MKNSLCASYRWPLDLHLPDYVDFFQQQEKVASFVCHPIAVISRRLAATQDDGGVETIKPINRGDMWINGGFFLFKQTNL